MEGFVPAAIGEDADRRRHPALREEARVFHRDRRGERKAGEELELVRLEAITAGAPDGAAGARGDRAPAD